MLLTALMAGLGKALTAIKGAAGATGGTFGGPVGGALNAAGAGGGFGDVLAGAARGALTNPDGSPRALGGGNMGMAFAGPHAPQMGPQDALGFGRNTTNYSDEGPVKPAPSILGILEQLSSRRQ